MKQCFHKKEMAIPYSFAEKTADRVPEQCREVSRLRLRQ